MFPIRYCLTNAHYAISRCVNKRKKFKTRVALFDLQLKRVGGEGSAFTQSNRRQQQGAKLHIISVDFFLTLLLLNQENE